MSGGLSTRTVSNGSDDCVEVGDHQELVAVYDELLPNA